MVIFKDRKKKNHVVLYDYVWFFVTPYPSFSSILQKKNAFLAFLQYLGIWSYSILFSSFENAS